MRRVEAEERRQKMDAWQVVMKAKQTGDTATVQFVLSMWPEFRKFFE